LSERRRAFRISTLARIAFRVLEEHEEVRARLGVVARSVPDMSGALGLDEGVTADDRIQVKILERMACYLNRIDRRMEELCEIQRGHGAGIPAFSEPIVLSLSAAGLSGELDLCAEAGALVELSLDLLDNSVPLIPAVASVVRNSDAAAARPALPDSSDARPESGEVDLSIPPKGATALHFEAITNVDRERIFRFATRIQRESLRDRKGEEER